MNPLPTLRDLKSLSCENSVAAHFEALVSGYLANPPTQKDEFNDELLLLVALCNHHRNLLRNAYQNGVVTNQPRLKTWLHELATPPSGEWAELRFSLLPYIRTFGGVPRPKGSALFSPRA